MTSLPWISIPTVALFFAEVRGYSKLYDNIADCPLGESASGNAVRWTSHWLWKCEVVTQCVCVRALSLRLGGDLRQRRLLPVFHRHVHLLDSPLPASQADLQGELIFTGSSSFTADSRLKHPSFGRLMSF